MTDVHNQWSHRYLSPQAISKSSKKHGLGVFALRDIPKGEIVGVLGGLIVPMDEIETYWKAMGHVGIQISDDFFIVPSSRKELELQGVFNHSCSPNIGFRNQIELVAISDIKVGEELCLDYAFCETLMGDFECACNSENCRKKITKNDWKLKNVQVEFREYFSPYIKAKLS